MIDDIDIDFSGIGTAWRAGNFIAGWIYGKGVEDVQHGFEYLQKAIDNERGDYLMEALRFFQKVGYNDKKYIVASSLYGKAVCHGLIQEFRTAYNEIQAIQDIEVGTWTMQQDVIYDMKSSSRELKSTLQKMEAELRKKQSNYNNKSSKLLAYILISIVVIALVFGVIWMFLL